MYVYIYIFIEETPWTQVTLFSGLPGNGGQKGQSSGKGLGPKGLRFRVYGLVCSIARPATHLKGVQSFATWVKSEAKALNYPKLFNPEPCTLKHVRNIFTMGLTDFAEQRKSTNRALPLRRSKSRV